MARVPDRPDFVLRRSAPDLSPFAADAGWLHFDDGLPDGRLLPADALARMYRRVLLARSSGNRLAYGDPRGSEALRIAIATMLSVDRGIACSADNICIVRGTQMGIFVATRLLSGARDTAVLESLSYPPAREAFRAVGAEVASVGLDHEGMRLDELEALCRWRRVSAVYVTPHHQFPTTVVMRPERRMHLLALAEQFGFAILEDGYDHEFHFAHRPLLPLASADWRGKVVCVGSLSKLLSPLRRIGYLAAPTEFIDRAAAGLLRLPCRRTGRNDGVRGARRRLGGVGPFRRPRRHGGAGGHCRSAKAQDFAWTTVRNRWPAGGGGAARVRKPGCDRDAGIDQAAGASSEREHSRACQVFDFEILAAGTALIGIAVRFVRNCTMVALSNSIAFESHSERGF